MTRSTPDKPTFTFRNGVTVTLERVGPLFALPIRKAFPPPAPPMAPGVGGQMEPNPADPDYVIAMATYTEELQLRIQDALLDAAISDDLEIDMEAVARIRRKAEQWGAPLPERLDRLVYIKYCLISHSDDLVSLFDKVATYGHVAEEDIRAAGAMFSSDRQRGNA